MTVPDGSQCLDIMGRTVQERPVRISPTPMYLVGPAGKARDLVEAVSLAGD